MLRVPRVRATARRAVGEFRQPAPVQHRRCDHRCAPADRRAPRCRTVQPRPFRRGRRTLRDPLLERRRCARGCASPHLERFSLAPAAHSGRRPGGGGATRRPAARGRGGRGDLAARRGQVQSHPAHERRRSHRRGDRHCLPPSRAPVVGAPDFQAPHPRGCLRQRPGIQARTGVARLGDEIRAAGVRDAGRPAHDRPRRGPGPRDRGGPARYGAHLRRGAGDALGTHRGELRVQEDAPVARRGCAGPAGSGRRRRDPLDQRAARRAARSSVSRATPICRPRQRRICRRFASSACARS